MYNVLILALFYLLYKWYLLNMSETNEGNSSKNLEHKEKVEKKQRDVNLSRREAGSNWEKAMKEKCLINCVSPSSSKDKEASGTDQVQINKNKVLMPKKKMKARSKSETKFVAMDCEMVGIGPCGTDDMLARVSIVNRYGHVLLDKYVKPREKVTNYRTSVSGIRPNDIENGEDFEKVQEEVVQLLQGKILVGHAIKHDLRVLYIKHPYILIRDTSSYRPLSKIVSNGHTPSLKRVTKAVLGIDIQEGEHNSVEDARAAMQVYNKLSDEWEKHIQRKAGQHHRHN